MSQLTSNPTESGWRRTAECKTTTRNFNLSAELHSSGNSLFRAHRINLNEGFTFNFARWIVLILIFFAIDSIEPAYGGAVVATTKEAYFNGSAYLRLLAPMPIWDHSAISFRSCRGGDILTQQYNKNSIAISVLNDFLQVSLAGPSVVAPNSRVDVNVQFNLLDNQWHTLQFKYEYGVLYLYVDRRSIVFANSTYNSQFLTNQDIGNEAAILILGSTFTGCMLDGPGLQFVNGSTVQNVVFGPCPLTVGPCGNYGDTLIRPSQEQNFCINDPCMGKGVCLSLADGYDCRCTARYTGKNCQIDNGPPCAKNPCANGSCIEDNRGDFVCICSPNHTGQFCESTINLHPLCQSNPCMNNGVCSVVEGNIQCECQKSFSGSRCEIEIDDCLSQPCLNNGRCIDLLNGFRCDCHDTGYTGPLCQTNIDECTQSSNPCMNGRCFDTHGWYICECQRGWGGENCDKVISCETYKCLNGGTCGNDYQCDCPSGYSGELCQLGPPCPQCPIDSQCIAGKCVCNPGSTGPIGHCTSISTTTVATEATLLSSSWPVKKPTPLPTSSHLIAHRPATHQPQTPRSAQLNACSKLCLNGGTCINVELGSSNDTCICASGFTGNNCEIPVLDGVFNSHVMDCHHNGGKCQNGGTCSMNGTHCYCPNGYRGDRCEKMDPCSPSNCQEPWICNKINKCVCPENKSCAACAAHPCRNGGICNDLGNGDYECKCNRFWTGRNCTNDVDECAVQPNICRNGICKNEEGNYKCYCTPGYTGIHCDSDVDECLSHPCENGATCHNKINAYECVCQKGYEGINCETDIDECASNPCVKGSCMDLVNNFTCNCIPGMTGRFCEIDIDDCVSAPCEHGGRCIDELDGFHCDCASTGYDGRFCETNINECLTHQCTNGAECIDQINDYMCNCFPGYRGKDCEIDINECESNPCQFSGNCLERSNRTLYEPTSNMDLPEIFRNEFSFENASGYECICVPGITGRNCEVNINECESNPCSKHGTCNDGIGSYTCDCDPGFEGTYCEINIDECERFKPCGSHGTCIDETNDYKCDCDANYGGKNCSVPLTGCVSSPCHNSGICKPYLINETEHRFTCICQNGYQGLTCEKTTTISMVVSSLITVKTHREEGYDINLQFKTTLPNGVLAFGTSGGQNEPVSYILELINGRLNLHSSLLNKWEGVFIGSKLNDSNWHKVFVAINTSHLVLSANDEQAIFPVGSYETANGSQPAFPLTYLGGTIPNLKSYLRHLTHQPSSFVGCMQDIRVNDKWIFPEEQITDDDTILVNIQSGCPRSEQCNPNPCHSNGECSDLWHTFSCSCKRPHFGHNCEYNITAATFGHENTSHSAVIVETNDIARRAIRSILSISMFIRTRQPTGQVFYLGSDPRKTAAKGTNDGGDSFVAAELQGGELLVKLQFNGTPEAYTVGGNKLDNGYNHLIEVARNQALVQVKLNGTEYFRKTLSSTGLLDAQVLYLGGPAPSIENLLTPSMTDDATNSLPSDDSINEAANLQNDKDYFKGIIQDVKISNGSRTMIVELYPLNGKNLELPPAFGEVSIDRSSVLKGEVTDDLCRKYPCKHNAECQNTWNDYICTCPNGYKGKDCQEIEFCQLVTCPGQSVCQNLDDGYECLTNITFTGNEVNPLTFTLHRENPVASEESKMFLKPVVEIEFRTRTGGTLLYVESNDSFFEIGVNSRQVTVTWKLKQEFDTKRFTKEMPNLERSMEMLLDEPEWRRIYLRVQNGKLEGGWKGWESMVDPSPSFSAEIDQSEFQQLLSHSEIYLAGMPMESQQSHAASSKSALQGSQFKGCLGEARVGDLLLPYFSNAEMYPRTENVSVQPLIQFRLNSSRPEEGCILCFSTDCKNGGFCSAPTEKYSCQCMPGYEDDDCSTDIDECLTAKCENNGTCINMIADFECSCLPGYGGRYCQNDIDECASQPCHNGGSCTDLIAKYRCDCTEDYAGLQCDVLKQVTCENLPCKNGSICEDGFNASTGNNFTCFCMDGYEGPMCDIPFCEVQTCLNGGLCLTTDRQDPTCKCSLGYTGRLCEKEINECESKPCLNGGLCTDLIGSYECNCANTGFQGVNCETDVDECSKGLGYCGESGLCINQPGNFKCICTYGFCGIYCNVTDPCRTGVSVCMNGAECVEVCTNIPDYFCNCTEGFTGKNCSDLITPKEEGPSTADIAIIVIPVVVVLLLIGAALLGTFLVMARNKRATRGTYSPSAQEYCNPRLEMDSVLKPPPEERLI